MQIENLVGQVIKGYELVEEIGTGGFGAVYRAHQPAVHREVAVKIILPDFANDATFIRRFEAEAQVVARLEHLHIVPLYDYWREPGGAYLVMRYLRGGSARHHLEKHGPWHLDDIRRLLDQITSALAVAHRNQIIHRDLKPDNILMDDAGNFYLADFGIAKDTSVDDVNKTAHVMGSPAYFSPEQIRSQPVTAQTDIYSLGVCLYEFLTGLHPFEGTPAQGMIFKHLSEPVPDPLEHRPDMPPAISEVIRNATAKAPEERYPDVVTFSAAFRQAVGNPSQVLPDEDTDILNRPEHTAPTVGQSTPTMGLHIPEPDNPYKGLRPFRQADAEDFFGRDMLVQKLLTQVEHNRVLTVIGPSGSGKSSVVHAGLLPALRRGRVPNSENWFYVVMHPNLNPMRELEIALLRVAVNPPSTLMKQLEENERGLLRALKRTLPDDESELVLVIDQFEELFTLTKDETLRQHFLSSLTTALNDPRTRLRLILTLRADFYDRPLMYPAFAEIVRESTAVVLPLSRNELEQAITGPAERVGLLVEPQLVNAMIADVGVTVTALPLLQYALTELYEQRDGRTLTLDAYHSIGGLSGALAKRAEELFTALWEPTQKTARQVFLRLVTLGEGTEDTRRRVNQSELLTLNPDDVDDAVEYVLDQFGKYRLLTFDKDPDTREPTVEVAHEALIRQWTRLRGWLEDNRDDLRTQRRLYAAATEWDVNGRDPSFLMRGTRLERFREWSLESSLVMNDLEQAYLGSSIQADLARLAQETARKEREEVLEVRSRRRLQAVVLLSIVAAIVGILLSLLAFSQRQTAQENANDLATAVINEQTARSFAERNAEEARSLALAASAQQVFSDKDTDLAIALALEANQIEAPPAQARRILAQAAYAPGTRRAFEGHTNVILSVVFSRDGSQIASASADGTLRLWNVETGDVIQSFSGHTAAVTDVAISTNNLQLLSASADGTARLWDVESGTEIAIIEPEPPSGLLSATFSPDGRRAFLTDVNGSIHRWDFTDSIIVTSPDGHNTPVYDLAFTPNGSTFVSAAADTTLRVWRTNNLGELRRLLDHQGNVYAVDIAPDGVTAISGDSMGSIRLWDIRSGQELKQFFGHTDAINDVVITPDGLLAVSGSEDGSVRVWDIDTSEELFRFVSHNSPVTSVAVSPDGRRVVSGARDNTLRLWDLQSGAELTRIVSADELLIDIRASADGAFALSGGRNGELATWDLTTGNRIRTLSTTKGTVGSLNFDLSEAISTIALSSNDRLALSGTLNGTVVIWDVNSGTDLRRLQAHEGAVTAAVFTPDGRQVITSGADSVIARYDVGTGDIVYEVDFSPQQITRLKFIPDTENLLATTRSGDLLLIDGSIGTVIRTIGSHSDVVLDVDVTPDGTHALTGARDGSLRLWALDSDASIPILRLEGHTAAVTGVSLSDDLSFAVSVSFDRTVIVWNLDLATPVQVLTGHTGAINAVSYLPGENRAVSAASDGTLRIWQVVALDELKTWTEVNRYRPTFTCGQREQYRIDPLCEASPDS